MREKADEIFAWGLAQRDDEGKQFWEAHSRGAAQVAETIAKKAGMDADKAYAMGLLHDIGRYAGVNVGMTHIYVGYEKMMEEGMPEVAKICLTHSFNPKDKVSVISGEEYYGFVSDFVMNSKYDDYDLLVQLADYMSGAHGLTTIERRFCSVLFRHNLPDAREELQVLYGIKKHFDLKCGMDVYNLFKEELSEAPFRGVPGNSTGAVKEVKNEI